MNQENQPNHFYNSENDGYYGGLGGYTDPHPTQPPTPPKKKPNTTTRVAALILACALVGTGAGVGGAALYLGTMWDEPSVIYQTEYLPAPTPSESISNITTSTVMTPDQLYASNIASCVGITISSTVTNAFGQVSTTAASGSGFVISADGYVVTNHHVIADATLDNTLPITVSFQDGTSYKATLVGYEAGNDLAVLKIDATNLNPVKLGDSDLLIPGQPVMAIGNPLGELTYSITDGIVSAMDRLITMEDGSSMNMLQTNAAINPGNSGGPLFNSQGEVIGITTAKYSTSSSGTSVEGLGFAIPINDVKSLISDLINYGYITGRPYLGVQISNVPEIAQQYGVSAGASVSFVAPGSCAEVGGLKTGDIVVAIDDIIVDSSSALTAALTGYKAGTTVELTVIRENAELLLSITLDEKNDETQLNNIIQPQQPQQQSNMDSQWPFGDIFP